MTHCTFSIGEAIITFLQPARPFQETFSKSRRFPTAYGRGHLLGSSPAPSSHLARPRWNYGETSQPGLPLVSLGLAGRPKPACLGFSAESLILVLLLRRGHGGPSNPVPSRAALRYHGKADGQSSFRRF